MQSLEPYRFYHCYPCLTEDAPADNLEAFYGPDEKSRIQVEFHHLFRAFGDFCLGATHLAPCPSWRAERPQLGDAKLSRFATRCHVFQQAVAQPGEPCGEVCDPSGRSGHGRYLGYVSLRPRMFTSPQPVRFEFTAVANLVPPSHMHRPRYHVITCVGGSADGVLPFRCAPFCVPNPGIPDKATCLYVAMYQGLLLKMYQFGFTPVNSADMRTLFWRHKHGRASASDANGADGGATLVEALSVLRDPAVNAGGVIESFGRGDFTRHSNALSAAAPEGDTADLPERLAKTEALRCLTDYLANGLPVVVQRREVEPDKTIDHAMLVLGMHLMQHPCERWPTGLRDQIRPTQGVHRFELPGRLICHDSHHGAYHEFPTAEFLSNTWLENGSARGDCGIDYLAILPRGAKIGIASVRRWTQAAAAMEMEFINEFMSRAFDASLSAEQRVEIFYWLPRLTRLLKPWQLIRRYFRHIPEGSDGTPKDHEEIAKAIRALSLSQSYWWAVEIRLDMVEVEGATPDRGPLDGLGQSLVYFWRLDDAAAQGDPRASVALRVPRGMFKRVLDPGNNAIGHAVQLTLRDDGGATKEWTYRFVPGRS